MNTSIFLLLLLSLCLSNPLVQLPQPTQPLFLKQPTEQMQMFVGQFHQKTFDDIPFLISSLVSQRQNYASGDISQDYDSNFYRKTDTYKVSNSCKLIPTWSDFKKLAQTKPTDANIHTYLFDHGQKIYIVRDSEVALVLLDTSGDGARLQIAYTVSLPADFEPLSSKLVKHNQSVYLLDSKNMYRIQNQNTDQREILKMSKVDGYKPVQTLVDAEVSPSGNILVLGGQQLYDYVLSTPTKLNQPTDIGAIIGNNDTYFVDLVVHNGTVCVLDRSMGIFTKAPNSGQFIFTRFNLTAYRKMQVFGNTLLVIGDFRKIRFVAQFFFLKDGGVAFNRFYDNIPLYNDIDFLEDKAIFIGDDELIIMAHSVHRSHLMAISHQFFDTFMAYGVVDFEVIKEQGSKKALLLGISYNSVVVMRIQQNAPKLRCDFSNMDSGKKTILVQFNTSICGTYKWSTFQQQFGNSHCRIRKAFKIQLKQPFQAKTSNMFMILLPFLTIIGIMVVVGSVIRWKISMNETIRRLRILLSKKDKGSSVNAINSI